MGARTRSRAANSQPLHFFLMKKVNSGWLRRATPAHGRSGARRSGSPSPRPGRWRRTFSTWPELMSVSAFLVRRIGSGQLRPRASSSLSKFMKLLCRTWTEDEARPAPAERSAPAGWLLTIAQLPTEDPAARMRVLRTLESLGAAVMREGVYLLPDTPSNRQSLQHAHRVHRQDRRQRARAARRRQHARTSRRSSSACSTARRATRT